MRFDDDLFPDTAAVLVASGSLAPPGTSGSG